MAIMGREDHLQIIMCYFLHLKHRENIANTGKMQG